MNDQSKSLLGSASVDPDKVETVSHIDAMPQAAQDGGLGTQAREEALGNLLAVIHGDGGHRALEVGTKQAALEAEKIVAGLFAAPSADKLRIAVEALEESRAFIDNYIDILPVSIVLKIDQALAALKAEGAK